MRAGTGTTELLGVGLYSMSEASRLTGVSPQRVRRWIAGYQFRYKTVSGSKTGSSRPLIHSTIPRVGNSIALSFLELVEIRIVGAFLERGVSLQTIRRAHRRAGEKLETPHPFACRKFKTDGKRILGEGKEFGGLLVLSNGSYAFPEILNQYLSEITFDRNTELAREWWPLGRQGGILIDPRVAFGAPVIAGTRIPVETVLDVMRSGETRESACYWFSLSLEQVDAAIEFERGKRAA
jgi:uncharacterized protein (DUF433 family)